jgi:hypothetical protein
VFATMATVATVSKRDFSGMGSWLFAGVVVLIWRRWPTSSCTCRRCTS